MIQLSPHTPTQFVISDQKKVSGDIGRDHETREALFVSEFWIFVKSRDRLGGVVIGGWFE